MEGNAIANWLRSENVLDDSVPANVQDAELHRYLKNGVALCKLIAPDNPKLKFHETPKFKFHSQDNLKAFAVNVMNGLPDDTPRLDSVTFFDESDKEGPKLLAILRALGEKRGVKFESTAPLSVSTGESVNAQEQDPSTTESVVGSPPPLSPKSPTHTSPPPTDMQVDEAVQEPAPVPAPAHWEEDQPAAAAPVHATTNPFENDTMDVNAAQHPSAPIVPSRNGPPPVPVRTAATEGVLKSSPSVPARAPVPFSTPSDDTTNPFVVPTTAGRTLPPIPPQASNVYTGPQPDVAPLIPLPPDVNVDHGVDDFGRRSTPPPMFTAEPTGDFQGSEENDEWLVSTLRRDYETAHERLVSSQLIYVDWPNYPTQTIWDLRITPYPALELRYAVTFSCDTPLSYQPKFTRLYERSQHGADSDEQYWQSRVEKLIDVERQPEVFKDMVSLLEALNTKVHGPEGRGTLLRSRSLIGTAPPVPAPPASAVAPSPLAAAQSRPVPPPPVSTQPRGKLVGLQNGRGQNVCFMNCLMQVLAHVCYAGKMKILLDQIFSSQHLGLIREQQPRRSSVVSTVQTSAVQALMVVLSSIYFRNEDKSHSGMIQLRKALSNIPGSHVVAPESGKKQEQQDVHELLVFLLDLIERASATSEPRHINFDLFDRVVRGVADLWEVMADLQWEERFSVGAQKVAAMFGHQGVTAYYCGFCEKVVQYRPEISTILNVPIGNSQTDISVQALVDELFAQEPLEDWRCELCQNKHSNTYRSTRLSKLPAFLVLHLVRGVISPRGELIRSKRKVGLENLQLQLLPRKGNPAQMTSYVPAGMIIHHGNTMDSGHYTAYATVGDEIVYFDDTNHRVVGKQLGDKDMLVVRENVTLVFFVRQS